MILSILSLSVIAETAVALNQPTYNLPATEFGVLVNKVADLIFTVIVIISVVVLVYGGFLFLTAGGNAERATEGKQVITYAIIGFVIAVFAKAIQMFLIKYFNIY